MMEDLPNVSRMEQNFLKDYLVETTIAERDRLLIFPWKLGRWEASLETYGLEESCMASLQAIIDGAVKDWNVNSTNSQWISTLKEKSKVGSWLSMQPNGQAMCTGSTSAETTTKTVTAKPSDKSEESMASLLNGSTSTGRQAGNETVFSIYRNQDGQRSKFLSKGKVNWDNGYKMEFRMLGTIDQEVKILFDASLMMETAKNKELEQVATALVKAVEKERLARSAAGELEEIDLETINKRRWNSTGYSGGNFIPRNRRY